MKSFMAVRNLQLLPTLLWTQNEGGGPENDEVGAIAGAFLPVRNWSCPKRVLKSVMGTHVEERCSSSVRTGTLTALGGGCHIRMAKAPLDPCAYRSSHWFEIHIVNARWLQRAATMSVINKLHPDPAKCKYDCSAA